MIILVCEKFSNMSYPAAVDAKSPQSCPTLCDPIDRSPPGFPVPGILQASTVEWVAISFSIPYDPAIPFLDVCQTTTTKTKST